MEKQYLSSSSEPTLQQLWQERAIYKATVEGSHVAGRVFSIDTPPPTVSGSLHIGHVFSYTHTDIAARYKRMQGFSVIYPFGFDDNGLPTERYVEKKREIRAETMKRSEFIALCLEETRGVEQEFKKLWQRLGFSVDWDLEYSTISHETQKLSQESFIRLYEKGYVYRQYEVAPYCAACKTSVAQAELDDAQQEATFYDVTFTVEDGTPLTIATTRPLFLPACVAVLYHPNDERYKSLAGKKIKVPLFDLTVPLIADEAIDPEKGTGLAMFCVFGDKQDVAWAKKLGIAYQEKQILGLDGRLNNRAGILEGLTLFQAQQKIVELLKEAGLITNQRPLVNTVNVHERCKKKIEYIALAQWFVKILRYKKEILAFADKIVWHPEFMKFRFVNWVESLGWDWCISRQRFFGIPFPVWHCTAGGHTLVPPLEALPIDPQEKNYFDKCPECSSTEIIPDSDVMDTWNTSSITPQIIADLLLKKGSPFEASVVKDILPLSIRPQAHDIIRTWAFDTIVKAWMHYGDLLPWREIVISGHVLSDSKEKLSKSKENSKLAPEQLLQTYSADAIRYWTASARLGHDVAFSENQLKIGGKLVTKLWNAFRFITEHTGSVQIREIPQKMGVINEWLLHEYRQTLEEYQRHLDAYEISLALQSAERFFWESFCDNYLEIIKDQFFNPGNYDASHVESTRWTLRWIGLRILQLFAPYTVHVTEQIYLDLYQKSEGLLSIHLTQFAGWPSSFEESATTVKLMVQVIKEVRRLKTEQQLSLRVPLVELTIYGISSDQRKALQEVEQLIRGVTQAQRLNYSEVAETASSLVGQDQEWTAHIKLED